MVLEPGFYGPLPSLSQLKTELRALLAPVGHYEAVLDHVRRWSADKRFQVGVHILEALATPEEAMAALTRIADATLPALLTHVHADYAERFGQFPGGALLGLAMGSYGGGDLTFTSDLDLILVYSVESSGDHLSTGPKNVADSLYFSGLARAFLTAITAQTKEGRLYDVDTRLRPSGEQGPIAVRLETFDRYYREQAWAWEHLALVRARPILGSAMECDRLMQLTHRILCQPRDRSALLGALKDMRARLSDTFGTENIWSVKQVPGGLLDLEFYLQSLVLLHADRHPALVTPRLPDIAMIAQDAGLVSPEQSTELVNSYHLQQAVQAVVRLCLGNPGQEALFSADMKAVLSTAIGAQTFPRARERLIAAQSAVKDVFDTHFS